MKKQSLGLHYSCNSEEPNAPTGNWYLVCVQVKSIPIIQYDAKKYSWNWKVNKNINFRR